MIRLLAIGLLWGLGEVASAQLESPVPLQLTGADGAQRQVSGLAMPSESSAGMSADAVRDSYSTYTPVNGTAVLSGTLQPPPAAYVAGMSVLVVPALPNDSSAMIDLNGLGPVPIVKTGGIALDSADLQPGAPHRLVFDGQRFHLISSSFLPCPAGYHVAAREYCIEDSSRSELNFSDAGSACINGGGRLCTFSEWLHACLSEPGFIGTVLDFEWVDHAANNTSNAKRVGRGSDGATAEDQGIGCLNGHHSQWSTPTRFRCCYTR